MLKLDAVRKFENTLLENFSVDHIRALKRSNWSGLLMEIDRLYATMFHEWDALQKDVTDIEEAVRSLTWSVNPFTRDGEEPEPLAAEVAKTVQDALWMRSMPVPGSVGHTFQQMLGAVVHAVYRGFNVHQIEWKNDGELVYPARFIQLPPQFLMWENRAGRPDRLLLVPDGMNYKGVPFPAHKFIVALNTSGPDHPIYNATFYSLVNWFLAFKKGIGWFMEYTQKYGMPKQILHYQSDRDRAQLMADLRDDSVLNTVLLKEGRDIDIQYPTGGSASLPQAVLLQKAEEACHKAILGQTLTSDTSSNGGSLAQARVHAGVQADVVLKRAEFVADVLNQQLIPAIVMANYGRIDGIPMPELRCKLPQAEANIERAQFLKTALEVPGVEIVKSEAYEYLGLAMPTEGDEVLKAPEQPQQQPGGMPGGFPRGGEVLGKEKQPTNEPSEETVMSARKAAPVDPTEEWLAPLKKKLAEARESGASLAEIKDQLRAWRPNTRALAAAMAQNIKEGFLGVNTENVEAGKHYSVNGSKHVRGCNQFEDQKGCTAGNKGTTREGETLPRSHKQGKENNKTEVIYSDDTCRIKKNHEGKHEVVIVKQVSTSNDATDILKKTIEHCREKRNGTSVGKKDYGFIAPGETVEFFPSGKTIEESILNDRHVKRSANATAHYSAAAIIDKLWEASDEGIQRNPKKGDGKDKQIRYVHERYAKMRINNESYTVKITAFEYKNKLLSPLLYDIRVSKQ